MKTGIKNRWIGLLKAGLVVVVVLMAGCEDFVEVDTPTTQIVREAVFESDATATSAIAGIYSQMMSTNGFVGGGFFGLSCLVGFSSDELRCYATAPTSASFYTNSLLASNTTVSGGLWDPAYKFIYYSNSVLEGLAESNRVSEGVKKQLTGEAKFIRAFCYFNLVNLFGDVPLVTTTDYRVNRSLSRASAADVYEQIVEDLEDARELLGGDYTFSKGERVRPNRAAAAALLARVHLFRGDWLNAEAAATEVISNAMYSMEGDVRNVFLKGSREAIWQLKPVQAALNTNDGNNFILTAAPTTQTLSSSLMGAFETGDDRQAAWVGNVVVGADSYPFPYKYRVKAGVDLVEYSVVLRLAEQYLIRAEARIELGKISDALVDLDVVRRRAKLPLLSDGPALSKVEARAAVERERRVELFSEWGHRWMDLKRWPATRSTGSSRADEVLSVIKGTGWQSSDLLYPIPQAELTNNMNVQQNPGY